MRGDALSLTLPKPTSLTRPRRRRVRPPSPWEVWFAGWAVYSILAAAADWVTGRPINAGFNTFFAMVCWRQWCAIRCGGRGPFDVPPGLALVLTVSSADLARGLS